MSGKQFVILIRVNRVGLERRQDLWEDLKKKEWAACISGGEWYWSEGLRWAFLVCWRYLQSDWRWLDKELMQGKIKQGLPGNCNSTNFCLLFNCDFSNSSLAEISNQPQLLCWKLALFFFKSFSHQLNYYTVFVCFVDHFIIISLHLHVSSMRASVLMLNTIACCECSIPST